MKEFIFLFIFVVITASIGCYLIYISNVTIKQIILCMTATALLQPFVDFTLKFIKVLIK